MHGMSQGASFPLRLTEAITFSHESESWLLILSVSIVNPHPGSTEAIAFSCGSQSWLLILSVLIINLPPTPRINNIGDHLKQRRSSPCWLSIDPPPPTDFRLSNLKYKDNWTFLRGLFRISADLMEPCSCTDVNSHINWKRNWHLIWSKSIREARTKT